MEKIIEIPEGYEARIEGNKVVLEPKESEDERIRKNLVNFIYDAPLCEFNMREYLDWIEKHKDNTEKEYVFRPLAGTDITTAAERAIKRTKDGDHLVLAFNGMYTPVSKYDSVKGLVDKYYTYLEEQKPAKWSEEDKNTLEDAITAVDLMLTDSFQSSHPNLFKAFLIAKDFLKSLPERFSLQPKREWSKEEKERIRQNGRLDVCYNPEKYGLCHKMEWSEEDEKTFWGLTAYIPEEELKRLGITRLDILKKFKSLRPQPHWKPSEKQIMAVEAAYSVLKSHDTWGEDEHLPILISLINDLKKLIM